MTDDVRDQIRAALEADDPITTMRALAIDLAGRGLSQAAALGAFGAIASELYESGQEDRAELVAEVIDMMAEWYAGGRPID